MLLERGTSFDQLQRWMQGVIVDPRHDHDVVDDEAERARLFVKPTQELTPIDRVFLYRNQYLLRMVEALQFDFAAVARFLGEDRFADLVADYVKVWPSTAPNLNRLSDHFREFLTTYEGVRRHAFVLELATLESTLAQVFELAPTPPMDSARLAAVPPGAWDRARLVAAPAVRILSFQYPVNDYLQAVLDERTVLPPTGKRRTWLAVWRQNYDLTRGELSRAQHRLLSALCAGTPLYDAFIGVTTGRGRVSFADALGWVTRWVENGVFADVVVDGGSV